MPVRGRWIRGLLLPQKPSGLPRGRTPLGSPAPILGHWGRGRRPPCNCFLRLGAKRKKGPSPPGHPSQPPNPCSVFSRTLHNDAASRVAPNTVPGSETPGHGPKAGTLQEGSPSSPQGEWGSRDPPAPDDSTEDLDNGTLVQGNSMKELDRAALLDCARPEQALGPGRVGLEVAVGEL